eukprot:scaffold132391_cov19-Tisochrysis_lutea.AAC.2
MPGHPLEKTSFTLAAYFSVKKRVFLDDRMSAYEGDKGVICMVPLRNFARSGISGTSPQIVQKNAETVGHSPGPHQKVTLLVHSAQPWLWAWQLSKTLSDKDVQARAHACSCLRACVRVCGVCVCTCACACARTTAACPSKGYPWHIGYAGMLRNAWEQQWGNAITMQLCFGEPPTRKDTMPTSRFTKVLRYKCM